MVNIEYLLQDSSGLIYVDSREFLPLSLLLYSSATILFGGLVGFLFGKDSAIILMLALEVMLFSIALSFAFFVAYTGNSLGLLVTLVILALVAAESVVGLSIVIVMYRLKGTLELRFWDVLSY